MFKSIYEKLRVKYDHLKRKNVGFFLAGFSELLCKSMNLSL